MQKYANRQDAGKTLAGELRAYANRKDVIVLGLARGGMPIAYEIAKDLNLPLDVFVVRKLGVPGHEELAMGAIAMGGARVFNQDILDDLQIPPSDIEAVSQKEQQELDRRVFAYRGNRPFPNVKTKTVILVDDGIATGATMRAAIKALRQMQPQSIIVATPVAAYGVYESLKLIVDNFICPLVPEHFYAVGAWYEHFDQTTDEEVRQLLA